MAGGWRLYSKGWIEYFVLQSYFKQWIIKNYNRSLFESEKIFNKNIIDKLMIKVLSLEIINSFESKETKPFKISLRKSEVLYLNVNEFIENITEFFQKEWQGKHVVIEQIFGSCFSFEENNDDILVTYRCHIE